MTDFKDTLYNMCSGFRLQCFLDSGDKSLYIEFLVEFRGIYYYISNSGFHSRCTGIRGHILIHSIKLVDSKDINTCQFSADEELSSKREYKIVGVKFEFNEIIIVSYHRTRLKHMQLNTKYSSRLRAIQNYDTYFNLSQ